MTFPDTDFIAHWPSWRSSLTQAGIRQGLPSGRVQSCQASPARLKPRPISMVSMLEPRSTSWSTTASCWIGS